jgi:hypothetical protein
MMNLTRKWKVSRDRSIFFFFFLENDSVLSIEEKRIHFSDPPRRNKPRKDRTRKMSEVGSTVGEIPEIEIENTKDLPWTSRIYQSLRKNRNTVWIAKLIKNPSFRNFMKFFLLLLYLTVGCLYYTHKEGWTPGTTIFFSLVTITTVGKSLSLYLAFLTLQYIRLWISLSNG